MVIRKSNQPEHLEYAAGNSKPLVALKVRGPIGGRTFGTLGVGVGVGYRLRSWVIVTSGVGES